MCGTEPVLCAVCSLCYVQSVVRVMSGISSVVCAAFSLCHVQSHISRLCLCASNRQWLKMGSAQQTINLLVGSPFGSTTTLCFTTCLFVPLAATDHKQDGCVPCACCALKPNDRYWKTRHAKGSVMNWWVEASEASVASPSASEAIKFAAARTPPRKTTINTT